MKDWLSPQRWSLPGGGTHRGEGLAEALCRELGEELGLLTAPKGYRYMGAFVPRGRFVPLIPECFVVEIDRSLPLRRSRVELAAAAWFAVDDLPSGCEELVREALFCRNSLTKA